MTISPHFFTGAVIGATTGSPIVAFLLGFFSHFILDAAPHLDPGTFFNIPENEDKPWPTWIYLFAILEFILTITVFFVLLGDRADFSLLAIGAIGGITVDILDNSPFRFIRKLPFFKQLHWIHEKLHYNLPHNKWYWGLPSEIIFLGGSIWFLLKF